MAVEFHPLTVSVRPETEDSVCVSFDVPDELGPTFRHLPGQHVVLRADLDGVDVRRSYSICTSPDSGTLSVGIKRLEGGAFSTFATTKLADGDVIDVLPPIGEFAHHVERSAAANYVALAAGSGITPILAIITTILEQEPASRVTLVYGNRKVASVMSLEPLEGLKNRYPDRFQLIHVLSREPNAVELFHGRIDDQKLRMLASSLIAVDAVDAWFVCGPLGLVETAQDTLVDLGVAIDRIQSELFFDERIEEPAPSLEGGDGDLQLTVTIGGRSSVVAVNRDGPSLLDYARSIRPEAPFACKGGMCASCKALLLEGEVTLVKNYALTEAELAHGYILSCQAHPVGGDVAITYDLF